MKHTLKFFSLTTFILLLFACGQKNTDTVITLDNGNKWSANPETTSGIGNMIQLMDTFGSSEESKDYKKLSSDLSEEFKMIFKNCTMQGEAHNQLHNYLLPMKSMLDELNSKEPSVPKETFDKLKAHLISYPNYFQ